MAVGTGEDFKIYNPQYQLGLFEVLSQNLNVFNGVSLNTMRLIAKKLPGDFTYEAFFTEISGLDSYRDTTSVDGVDDLKMSQNELTSVKLNRKIGPVAETVDGWKKLGKSIKEMSYILGKMAGEALTKSYLTRSIIAVQTAIESIGATAHYPGTAAKINYSVLNSGNKLFGDASGNIITYLMHSTPYHDLVGTGIEETLDTVATYGIKEGKTYSLNRRVIVTDDSALVNTDGVSSGVDSYYTLGLVSGAVTATQSEETTTVMDLISDTANISYRYRADYAFNVEVKGFQYVVATGKQPTDATLGDTASWDQQVTSIKNGPGIIIETA